MEFRRALEVIGLAGTLVAVSYSKASFEHLATGYVFFDENDNQIFDDNEKGIEGIPVSNGSDIAVTDWSGAWQLPYSGDAIFFAISRDGWSPPLDSRNVPRFYYVHEPDGSQVTRFPGHGKTGALPDQIDFPMHAETERENYSVLLFGDPQRQVDFFARDIVSYAIETGKHAFGISLGDIINDDLSLFDTVNDLVSLIGIPWYNVAGNHDKNTDVSRDEDLSQAITGRKLKQLIISDVSFLNRLHFESSRLEIKLSFCRFARLFSDSGVLWGEHYHKFKKELIL